MGSYLLVMISQVLSKMKTMQANDTSITSMKEIHIFSKNRRRTIQDFILITSLSLGVLAGWVVAIVEDAISLLFGSSLAGMGRVARTNSRIWEAPPSLEVSLGASEGFVISKGASCSLAYSSPFWRLLGGGGSLDKASSVGLATLEGGSSRESEGPEVRMTGG